MPKDGEHSRTLQDSSKIHLVTPSGKWHNFIINIDSELCTLCYCSIFTSQWSFTVSLNRRKKIWCPNGDGTLVKTIGIMITLTRTDVYQLTVKRTTCDIRTSIKWEGTRESAWFTLTGGAETRTSESTLKWGRDTISSQPWVVSTMKVSTRTQLPRTKLSLISEQAKLQDDHAIYPSPSKINI